MYRISTRTEQMEPFPAPPQLSLRHWSSRQTPPDQSVYWCFTVGDRRAHATTEGVWSQRALSSCSPWAAVGRQAELMAVRVRRRLVLSIHCQSDDVINTRGESEDVCLRHGGLNGCGLKPAKHQRDTPVVKTKSNAQSCSVEERAARDSDQPASSTLS